MKLLLISTYIISAFIPTILADITASASDFVGMDPDAALVNSNAVLASSPYCNQYKNRDIELYFDKNLLKDIGTNQYLLKDFNDVIQKEGARVDYFTRFIHIAKGLCYYDDDRAYKPISETPVFYNNGVKIDLRYVKTVNCYYMYNKYLAKGIENNEIPKLPCGMDFATYYNSVYYFVQNSTLCPYPQNEDVVSVGNKKAVDKARYAYLLELLELYKSVENNDDCYDDYNEEVVNCGYANHLLKTTYCNAHPTDACCKYQSHIQNKIQIKYDFSLDAIIPGMAIAGVYVVIGMIFSVKPIKDIKTKKRIEKVVANQEHHNNGHASDSNSYLNSPQSHTQNTSDHFSQILPASNVDITNYNSNNYLLGSNNNVVSSVNSLNIQQASSLYSRSSVDLGSDFSFPADLPSNNGSERPSSVLERPNRNFLAEHPLSPNQRYPPSPNIQRPTGSPNMHPSSSTPNLYRLNQSTPNLQSIVPLPPNLNPPTISPTYPNSKHPNMSPSPLLNVNRPPMQQPSPNVIRPSMPQPSPNVIRPSMPQPSPNVIRPSMPQPSPNVIRPPMPQPSSNLNRPPMLQPSSNVNHPPMPPPSPNLNRPPMPQPSPNLNRPSPNINRQSMPQPPSNFNPPSPNLNHPSPISLSSNINRQSMPQLPPNFNLPSPNVDQQVLSSPPPNLNLPSPGLNCPSIPPSIPSTPLNSNLQSVQSPPPQNLNISNPPVSYIEHPPRSPEFE